PSVRIAHPLSMGEFLRRHAELLMTRVVYWHGDVNRDEVSRVLRDLRFVCETYGLVIPASMSRRALADLAILISLWCCADRGVDDRVTDCATQRLDAIRGVAEPRGMHAIGQQRDPAALG